ncbi:DUF1839 family protein [Phenylobacterium aquaticum]|uniref:DUF1839 family protein n=1 Tax=Phenylobacterium aquaticum TaxID=1763816 RepID=UPI0026EB3792|nr:DUF1839 family protein [Phenylobacterium aquaticum]
MQRAIPAPDPQAYAAHRLHDAARSWPLSNCYIDLWIELLATAGRPPEAMLSFAVELDFEGDQFTFAKPGLDDLRRLYGVTVQELAVYDRIEAHLEIQIARGRPCLVEVDSYFLPDTKGLSYRLEHGKTTVAVNALSAAGRRMEYFHNGGYHLLEGEDYDGLMAGYARAIAQSAKAAQFKLARACAKQKFDGLETSLDAAALAYGQLMAGLDARVRSVVPA